MKKLFYAICLILLINNSTKGQNLLGDFLDINNLKMSFSANGGAYFQGIQSPVFEAPKGSGKSTFFARGLWIGGLDVNGQLKLAGQTYENMGSDFYPGPLDATGSTDSATMANYNRVWKITKCGIDHYTNFFTGGSVGPNTTDVQTMDVITNWPAFAPDGHALAPFNDIYANGVYEPYLGETPMIKGDEAIFFVFNDNGGLHNATGGNPIGIEVHGMAYAYSCTNDSALYNTIFVDYTIINKSSNQLDSTYIGNWTDFDIGGGQDDYIASDVARSAYYGYNGDSIDDGGGQGQPMYGINPPAQAVVFLEGPYQDPDGVDNPPVYSDWGNNHGNGIIDDERLGMSTFMFYNNDFTPTGNPVIANDFYNYMTATWKNGTHLTYGGNGNSGSINCNYFYPGTTDPLGIGTSFNPQTPWSEESTQNVPSDRRAIGTFGPFTLQPNGIQKVSFAYVYARTNNGSNLTSVNLLKERIDSIRQKFSAPDLTCGCNGVNGNCVADFTLVQDSTNLFNYTAFNNSPAWMNYNYLWEFGDGDTSTLQYPTHVYAGTGPYQLCLTVSDTSGCSDTFCDSLYAGRESNTITLNVVPGNATSISENKDITTLRLYPNPTNNILSIVTEGLDAPYKINILDITGRQIQAHDNINSKETVINVSQLESGIYFLTITDGKQTSTKKFIKQ
ncbi:MAG: T9SS type A sorting domain-containing protein [Bacteroidetes bacterium]|nr:T9SS type A sorting domain-containing protein [Bacteroidota bacterium]